jgi:hypothetical protein
MTQVYFSRKRNLRLLVASRPDCGLLDTTSQSAQSCVRHKRPHMSLVFLTDRDRCREH